MFAQLRRNIRPGLSNCRDFPWPNDPGLSWLKNAVQMPSHASAGSVNAVTTPSLPPHLDSSHGHQVHVHCATRPNSSANGDLSGNGNRSGGKYAMLVPAGQHVADATERYLQRMPATDAKALATIVGRLSNRDCAQLVAILNESTWGKQARTHVARNGGEGDCVGLSYGRDGPYIKMSNAQAQMSRRVLEIVSRVLPDDFGFSSIQFNHNTVSDPHKDSNNEGWSIMVGVGSYQGGLFEIQDPEGNWSQSFHAQGVDSG